MDAQTRARLVAITRDILAQTRGDPVRLSDSVMRIDAARYTDPARFEREKERLFRRLPLMLAASCEIRAAGAYKTIDVAGVPVLLTRGKDGAARAFLNACTHRGSAVADGCGTASRFSCPYHGWTFDGEGRLVGINTRSEFGDIDAAANGLRPFPVLERAGLVWVVLDPRSDLDIARFLSGFDALLDGFGFADWHFQPRRALPGPNWKLAFDAHNEFYHLPVLHGKSFGTAISNKTLSYPSGPHQRLARPAPTELYRVPDEASLYSLADRPEAEWGIEAMLQGGWIIFPNVGISTFYDGGRGVMLSQVIPGATVDQSTTIQTYLTAEEPDAAARERIETVCDFVEAVVRNEDLACSFRQQSVLQSGLLDTVHLGRNEGGVQHLHQWVDRVLETPDDKLNALFAAGPATPADGGPHPVAAMA